MHSESRSHPTGRTVVRSTVKGTAKTASEPKRAGSCRRGARTTSKSGKASQGGCQGVGTKREAQAGGIDVARDKGRWRLRKDKTYLWYLFAARDEHA